MTQRKSATEHLASGRQSHIVTMILPRRAPFPGS